MSLYMKIPYKSLNIVLPNIFTKRQRLFLQITSAKENREKINAVLLKMCQSISVYKTYVHSTDDDYF